MYPGPDVEDAQRSMYLYKDCNTTIDVELLNASMLPMLWVGFGLFFFSPSECDTSGHQTNL